MQHEKLRLRTAYLLLGCRGVAMFVSAFPVLIKLMMLCSAVLAALRYEAFVYGEYSTALLFLFVLAQIGGFVLLRCFVLVRYRWFNLRSRGTVSSLCSLITRFSLSDFMLAAKLWVFSRIRYAAAVILFFSIPSVSSVFLLRRFYSGVSGGIFVVVLTGLALLWAVGAFFFFSAVSSTRGVCGICCFEREKVFLKLWRRSSVLDRNALKYVRFKLLFYPWFGSKKLLANSVFVREILSK